MAWPFRHVPNPRTVFEITSRACRGRFAFVPRRQLVKEWIGLLAVALERWGDVKLHQICVLSNHVHILISVGGKRPANQLARWASFVFGNAARISHAVHGHRGVRGRIWSKRYSAIAIQDDATLRARVKYVMAQATAANLVARPRHWPGLNTVDALCRGTQLLGYRADAALRRRAKNERVPLESIAERKTLTLTPLPALDDLSMHQRQRWYRQIEREIIEETDARLAGRRLPDPELLRAVDPTTCVELERSDAPQMHVSPENHTARRDFRAAYRAFVDAWRTALTDWLAGGVPCFPHGGWVPFGMCRVQME